MRMKLFAAAASVAALSLAGGAQAMTFLAADGTGQAVINLTGNKLTVALSNLVADAGPAAGEISGIQIYFDTSPTNGGGFTQKGQLIDWLTKNPLTWALENPANNPDHWAPTLTGQELYLTTLSGAKPYDLIAGAGPNYVGNASTFEHTPSIVGTGTFTLTLLGNLPTTINKIVFEYGTSPTENQQGGSCTADCGGFGGGGGVPEPATWALMLLGFGGLGAVLRRRRAGSPSVA
jgi:hypothetical protein